MKKTTLVLLALVATCLSHAQQMGNINYMHTVRYPDSNIDISFPGGKNLLVSVKGMANVKADSYVAIFSVVQTAKTAEEVNSLIDSRLNQAAEQIRKRPNTEVIVDMVSFVPVYEYEADKK